VSWNRNSSRYVILTVCLAGVIGVLLLVMARATASKRKLLTIPKNLNDATNLINKGGIEALQVEATRLHDYFTTNASLHFLPYSDRRHFPLIANLGDSIVVMRGASGVPETIRIRFGDHFNVNCLFDIWL
jgi:hypothetical protein